MLTVVDEIQYWDQVTVRHTPQVNVRIYLFLCISEGSFEEVRAEICKQSYDSSVESLMSIIFLSLTKLIRSLCGLARFWLQNQSKQELRRKNHFLLWDLWMPLKHFQRSHSIAGKNCRCWWHPCWSDDNSFTKIFRSPGFTKFFSLNFFL